MFQSVECLPADELWLALADLIRHSDSQQSFAPAEILRRAQELFGHSRSSWPAHLEIHNLANLPPESADFCLMVRLPEGTLRLFRPGDERHPLRRGRTYPDPQYLPSEFQPVVRWYLDSYVPTRKREAVDPVIAMLGVARGAWDSVGGGEAFVRSHRRSLSESLRSRQAERPAPPLEVDKARSTEVWARILSHQGQEFHTVTNLPFKYEVDGNGIWFFREGRKIDMRLSRSEVDKALARRNVRRTTDLSDLRDYPYLFALLRDPRIQGWPGSQREG